MRPVDEKPLPVLEFDWRKMRELAENIYHAQKAGWPPVLTYDYEKDATLRKVTKAWKRQTALEHRGPVWVGHVPAAQNNLQGSMIAAFLRQHGAYDGKTNSQNGGGKREFKFRVRVINRPVF